MIGFKLRKERVGSPLILVGQTAKPLRIMMSVSVIIALFTFTCNIMVYAQNSANTTGSNMTQTEAGTANRTETAADSSTKGIQTAINETGQFLGNVSETVAETAAENPVVINATRETQEFFGDKSK
jgi:hypothetical protein